MPGRKPGVTPPAPLIDNLYATAQAIGTASKSPRLGDIALPTSDWTCHVIALRASHEHRAGCEAAIGAPGRPQPGAGRRDLLTTRVACTRDASRPGRDVPRR